jgi:D-alanyl-D-alanine carboxypeptidase (penicillin-binding protein 5/6)
MKRIVTLFLSLILLLSCLCAPASALFDPSLFYEVQAKSAYIVNTDTNIIVYDKDSSRQVPAGGLTKYMTIALLLTNYADQLDNTFQMPFAISDYVHNSDNADMRSNETFTYREAVYAMLLRNANEAAMGLAYSLSGGDLAGWVSQMNTLSQRIGTTGSTWTDACGLDSGNVTTAVDMYLILRYLMSFDAFVDISSAPAFTMPAKEKHTKSFVLLNQNVALNKTSGGSFYRKSMQGGMCDVMAYKNDHGDQSYVSWANQDGSTYIFCIMQSPDTCDTYGYANRRPALYETTRLIDWVFQSFSIQPALDTDLALAEIPVKYSSDTDTLKLYPDNSMMTLLPSSGDGTVTQKYFHLPDYVCAPVQQGDVVGTVELKLAGETDSARRMMRYNTDLFRKHGITTLVTSCPICLKVFREDYELAGIEVLHHSEYILRLIRAGRLDVVHGPTRFTYHDPCELGRGSGIYDEPRAVIEAVGELLEPAQTRENAPCCGSSVANTAISDGQQVRLAQAVAEELEATGAEVIVTACPLCKKAIGRGTRGEVRDLAEIVAAGLK